MKGEPVNILLVEDDPAHAEIVRRNLQNGHVANRIVHVSDGEDALNYLYRRNKYQDSGEYLIPHLVLLDLRLPKVDGLEVLRTVKSDPSLSSIPVVILTTSAAETDLAKAYSCHANSYLVKPVGLQEFVDLMKTLNYYWLAWNRYPTDSHG